ncbi:acyl-CoA reductase-like NAD-dependent aldehyde dehydrogenase [Sphingomonas zeicaulis]|uniref:aldehyde dehydrogenase family protein n=1 Tax=Sphingomonas zeicaulis TaxID=1632740 RepID=UPI003D1EF7D7
MSDFKLLIDGVLTDGARTMDVVNPATGEAFETCPVADEAQLNAAVAAAAAAFPAWSALPIEDRAARIDALADALQARADEFARLLTAEQGKPDAQAKMEVIGAVFTLRAFAAMRLETNVIRDDDKARIIEVRRPLGVVGAILPWNFPVILLMNKLAPALLAGNTLVAKPAPTTPLTTLLFGTLCAEILPPGVVNILCDENDLGGALTAHPGIAKLSFTGSTVTGKKVMQAAAATLKRVTLELGGNDAAIILDDADPIATARKIFQGAMANAGQVCIAIKRAYVPEAIYDVFCEELARLATAAVVDDGAKQGAQIGPVQNAAQYEKLKALLDESAREGKVIAGGVPLDRPGFFIAPTIVRDVTDDARIVREEQFGPVLPVLSYTDVDDAVARANASEFGLGGSVWGSDLDRATDVALRIQSGTAWVNQHMALSPTVPFRGAKQSGVGGELGLEGLHEYTQPMIVNVARG